MNTRHLVVGEGDVLDEQTGVVVAVDAVVRAQAEMAVDDGAVLAAEGVISEAPGLRPLPQRSEARTWRDNTMREDLKFKRGCIM